MSQPAGIATMSSNLIELECSACAKKYDASREQHLCTCGKPLLARYDLKRAAGTFTLETLKDRPRNLWRLERDRKSTRLNSSHTVISYAVFCLKKKNTQSNVTN